MKHILIIDDHPVVLHGLKGIINTDPGLHVGAEAFNGREALKMIRQQSFDLAIMDFSLPDISGFDLLEEIKYICPKLPVLVLSILPEAEYAPRVIQAGAAGYLNKKYAAEEVIRAVKQVLSGKPYMSRKVANELRSRGGNQKSSPGPQLSNRELEVARLLVRGKPIREIAAALGLTVSTVHTYRTRLMSKLCVRCNVELARYMREHKMDGN